MEELPFKRMDASTLGAERLAPLDALMSPQWPEIWREMAASLYVTLLSAPGASTVPLPTLASLAVSLAHGVTEDLGGAQHYIPRGNLHHASTRANRAMAMLAKGQSYRDAAKATGLSEPRIRQIEQTMRQRRMDAQG